MPTCERCGKTELVRGKRSNFSGVCIPCYRSISNTVTANNKRARRHGIYGRLRTYDWLCVLSASNWCCVACGIRHGTVNGKQVTKLTLDHIQPMARGGMNIRFNTQPLCPSCHTLKDGDPDLLPWRRDEVLSFRRKKAKSQAFFHQLMNTFAGNQNPNYFKEVKKYHQSLVESGEEDLSFGEFLIEQFLILYIENRDKQHE
jgi:hypothetical protein